MQREDIKNHVSNQKWLQNVVPPLKSSIIIKKKLFPLIHLTKYLKFHTRSNFLYFVLNRL